MPVVPEPRVLTGEWLRACDAFLSATLAHARYLRARGRLADPESAKDIAALEEEHLRVRLRRTRLRADMPDPVPRTRVSRDPAGQLSLAARRELRRYRDAVCEDSRWLRARSAVLVRDARRSRRLRVLDGSTSEPRPSAPTFRANRFS